MIRYWLIGLAALLLGGCEVVPPAPTDRIEVIERGETRPDTRQDDADKRRPERAKREVAFSEAEYANLEKRGTAAISGRLTLSGRPVPDAGISVAPVTRYSAEAAEKALAGIPVEPADPRAQEYTHTTRTDADGNFRIANLPSGEFYVSGAGPDPTNGRSRVVVRQVSLGNGQHREISLSR
ncbi:MAG: carboxypeptidase-like regulatory domain-containing protein [Halomonas sp.]